MSTRSHHRLTCGLHPLEISEKRHNSTTWTEAEGQSVLPKSFERVISSENLLSQFHNSNASNSSPTKNPFPSFLTFFYFVHRINRPCDGLSTWNCSSDDNLSFSFVSLDLSQPAIRTTATSNHDGTLSFCRRPRGGETIIFQRFRRRFLPAVGKLQCRPWTVAGRGGSFCLLGGGSGCQPRSYLTANPEHGKRSNH